MRFIAKVPAAEVNYFCAGISTENFATDSVKNTGCT
jgi:hypothetical protein